MHEQLHETTRNASFNDGLDLVIGTIGQVRDSPASINEDFIVKRVDKLGKNGKCGKDLLGVLANVR